MRHYLESVDMYLNSDKGLNITSDALNLVQFIKGELENIDLTGEVLDIGSGIGTLSFLLSKEKQFKKFHCVEFQKEVFEVLKENIYINGVDFLAYNLDINNMSEDKKYEYIISNPPFYKINSGKIPEDEIIAISKFEIKLTLKELLDKVFKLLKNEGYFFLIIASEREKEILKDKRFNILNKKEFKGAKKSFLAYNMEKSREIRK